MLPPCSSSLVNSSHSYDETITNRHPRNDALALLPRLLLDFRRATAAMRSLMLDACLSSMQARKIENTLSMKAEDGWSKAMFSSRARSQSSAVYHGSYTVVPSVLCLLVLSSFSLFFCLLYFVFCLIWRAESEDAYRLYVAVLHWSILLCFHNRKHIEMWNVLVCSA